MFKSRMLRVFGLALAMPCAAFADLPELFGNMQIPSTLPSMVEDSADLIIQVPRQVDPASPVPLRVRVLQSPVAAITLLSDSVDPVQLASFEMQPGVDAQLATRFMSSGAGGVMVVVRTATNRIFAGRRTFELMPNAGLVVPEAPEVASVASVGESAVEADSGAETEASQEVRLDAEILSEDRARVVLRSAEPLVKRMQHQVLRRSENPVSSFELKHKERVLVSADLDASMWSDPFFSFGFVGAKVGDTLTLTWVRADGEQGELQTTIEPAG